MRVLVALLLSIAALSGCIETDASLDEDAIRAAVEEALEEKEREDEYVFVDLDGDLEYRLGDGEWTTEPPAVVTTQEVSHGGNTTPLRLEPEGPGDLQVRYSGSLEGLTGEWYFWSGYDDQVFDIADGPVTYEWDRPGQVEINLFVQLENNTRSHGNLRSSASWISQWVVTGTLAGEGPGAPSAHQVIPPIMGDATIQVDVRATDEPTTPGRKTVLALEQSGYSVECSRPDSGFMVESTDHTIVTDVWGDPGPRILYGHDVASCSTGDVVPDTQDVAYQMDIIIGPRSGGFTFVR